MSISRLLISSLLLASALHAAEDLAGQAKQARSRAIAALLKKQSPDGAWRSEDYAVFKNGAALTALALDTFSRLPDAERAPLQAQLDKALAFLITTKGKTGGLGFGADWNEYPVYTTALAVTAVARLKPDDWKELLAEPCVHWLKSQQHLEPKFLPDSPVYGGWSPHGISSFGPNDRADISTTRHVLQALFVTGFAKDDLVWTHATRFVKRCQNVWCEFDPDDGTVLVSGDGGFCYCPGNEALNKAGADPKRASGFKSYNPASIDGYWCLDLLEPGTAHQNKARAWLVKNVSDKQSTLSGPAHEGLRYYYFTTLHGVPQFTKTQRELVECAVKSTLQEQGADGLWRNPVDTMKENDPILASLLALQVLLPENAK